MSLPKPKKPKFPIVVRRVVGHSMLPVLPPGTLVFAFTFSNRPRIGSVVIIKHEDKEKIKRISDVKEGEIFVIGDHDTSSTDSRQFGWISDATIIAKVVWPRTHIKT